VLSRRTLTPARPIAREVQAAAVIMTMAGRALALRRIVAVCGFPDTETGKDMQLKDSGRA